MQDIASEIVLNKEHWKFQTVYVQIIMKEDWTKIELKI